MVHKLLIRGGPNLRIIEKTFLKVCLVLPLYSVAHAEQVVARNTSPELTQNVSSNIYASPIPTLSLKIGGSDNLLANGSLKVSAINNATISVTASASSDEHFYDRSDRAQYFGYYLSVGVSSTNQTASHIHVKVRRGSGETPNRSYYIHGNEKSSLSKGSDLITAPISYATFAVSPTNSTYCGSHYSTNHLSGKNMNCEKGVTVKDMDITQFVKVMDTDMAPSQIISQLEFVAIPQ